MKDKTIDIPYEHTAAHPQFNVETQREQNIIGTRLQALRTRQHISQKALAERLVDYGVNISSSGISKWEKGDGLPNANQLFAVCFALHLSDVLPYFTGQTDTGKPLLNERGMKKVQEYMHDLVATGLYAHHALLDDEDAIEKLDMKIFDQGAAAGLGSFLDSDHYEITSFPASVVPTGTDFGVHVCGQSMTPNYIDGQIAWVEQCSELAEGEIGIFVYEENAYIKMFHTSMPKSSEREEYTDSNGVVYPKITLMSLNPSFQHIYIRPYSEMRIVGRVLN